MSFIAVRWDSLVIQQTSGGFSSILDLDWWSWIGLQCDQGSSLLFSRFLMVFPSIYVELFLSHRVHCIVYIRCRSCYVICSEVRYCYISSSQWCHFNSGCDSSAWFLFLYLGIDVSLLSLAVIPWLLYFLYLYLFFIFVDLMDELMWGMSW